MRLCRLGLGFRQMQVIPPPQESATDLTCPVSLAPLTREAHTGTAYTHQLPNPRHHLKHGRRPPLRVLLRQPLKWRETCVLTLF